MEEKYCPCCGRHCSLDDPHCKRGEEFKATGKVSNENHNERRIRYHEMNTENKLIFNFRTIGHTLHTMSDGKASQNRILHILSDCKSITQSELTEQLGIQPGSASEVIGKLERAGLIVRSSNEKDRRTSEIKLTEEGEASAKEAIEQRNIRNSEMFSALSETEKQTLLELLEKINPHSHMHHAHFHNHEGRHHGHHHEGHHGGGHREE